MSLLALGILFFFFQAEDGIRDIGVTGVQTCALPICGWEITGNKMWISLGNHAEVALIFAQTDPKKQHRGLAAFLVPTESEGFSSQEIHGKMGLHGSDTAALNLDGVRVDDDALMGEVGDGFKIAMSALDSGRYSVAAGCVSI